MPIAISNPLQMINPVTVRSSSLAQVAYDGRRAMLQVEFRDGAVYQYATVPIQTYRDLLRATSKGSYFNLHIRGRYPHAALRSAPPHSP